MLQVSTPSRRRPAVPPLSELDAPRPGIAVVRRPAPDRAPDASGAQPSSLCNMPADQDEQVLAAQLAVAEERAAAARAVLAERAAKVAAARKPTVPRSVASYALLAAAVLALAARLWLVGTGAPFGPGPVWALDAGVATALALGLALAARPRLGQAVLGRTRPAAVSRRGRS